MRKYNLFVIKQEYYNLYKNKMNLLFDILISVRRLDNDNGIFLYKQICEIVDIELLNEYLNDKFNLDKKYCFFFNNVVINLKYTRIIVTTKYNFPKMMKFFNCYNRHIFVIDFKNRDYFWLNEFSKDKVLI